MPTKFWADEAAGRVVRRERRLNRGITTIRVESGVGASGFPHIGSAGDSLRAYCVKLGIGFIGEKGEMIAYSDDRDGLRKVPMGIPPDYEKYLGMPVTDIPDPWGCHESYGEHMGSLLIEALEELQLEFEFISGTRAYREGLLDREIDLLLRNQEKVDSIIREEVGSSKPRGWIHYWPVCEECGRIYTTRVEKVMPDERKVIYACDQEFKGVKPCGCRGEAKYTGGSGKLAWMSEFAARWSALKICFEPHGKDIDDSFRTNLRICREVLGFEPPLTIMYEMFLDRTGSKISKSTGNVVTPQQWMRYAPPETLRMLAFKRYRGTRHISLEGVPSYISELEDKISLYHNPEGIQSERERTNLRRLMEYTYLLSEVPSPRRYKFRAIQSVINLLPHDRMDRSELIEAAADIIARYYDMTAEGLLEDDFFKRLFHHALNYASEMGPEVSAELPVKQAVKDAIISFAKSISERMSSEEIQRLAFSTARRHEISARDFFSSIYTLLLGKDRGPKLGPLIERLGAHRAQSLILKSLGDKAEDDPR